MNMYVILSSTCFGPSHAHLQEEQLYNTTSGILALEISERSYIKLVQDLLCC